MQMTLSSSSLFTHSALTQAFLTFKMLFNNYRSLLGWLLIFLLLTRLRLNSCSSDSKTNLLKYTTLHLTPPTQLKILASSFTNILPSLTKWDLSPKPVTITFVNFSVYGLTSRLDLSTVCTIATSIVHSKLDYCNSLYYSISLNYPVCIRPSTVISLPSYALSTGSKSLNASNTSSSHLQSSHNYPTSILS